jgi:hypothetical protein
MKRKIILLFITLSFLIPTLLALDCPHGEINDTYPGDCNLYTDVNKDKICDHSQTLQETKPVIQTSQVQNATLEKRESTYHLLIIAIISTILYLLSSFLSRAGKIYSPCTHKKIWNALLLISFLGVGLSGLLFVLRIEFGIDTSWFPNMLFWHVETGIVMALISMFHVIWHLSYFKSYFRK